MIYNNLSKREHRFFDVAKAVSKTSDYHGVSIGCVVTYKRSILSVASNSEKTHTSQQMYNKFRGFDVKTASNKLHAEVHALVIAKNINFHVNIDWSAVSVYVYREHKNGTPAISKPCLACFNLIKDLGIKTIYYINEHGQKVKERL